jgi:hypothetical protein
MNVHAPTSPRRTQPNSHQGIMTPDTVLLLATFVVSAVLFLAGTALAINLSASGHDDVATTIGHLAFIPFAIALVTGLILAKD